VPRILEELRAQGFRVVHVVPKAGAETLAEYDTLAQEAAERRRVTAAAGPLAKRAITWPSSISPNAHGSVAPPASPAPAVHSASPREDWTADFWRQSQ
jgi:hypothetical protein